jgi:hypothetical protein
LVQRTTTKYDKNGFPYQHTESVKDFDCEVTCRICGRKYDPFADAAANAYQVTRLFQAVCSEDCWVESLVRHGIKGQPHAWTKLRAPTEQVNLSKKLIGERGERQTLSSISAERQRRLDAVKQLWDEGLPPIEIGKRLGHRHTAIYHDLKALNIDPKQSQAAKQQGTARDALLSRIRELLDQGYQYKEIAPIVGLSPSMVGYMVRNHLGIKDGRSRGRANRHKQPAANKEMTS